MLTHPTHDRLLALGLTGIAMRLKNSAGRPPSTLSRSKSASAC